MSALTKVNAEDWEHGDITKYSSNTAGNMSRGTIMQTLKPPV